jgi:hypothetical protein
MVQSQPRQNSFQDPISKTPITKNGSRCGSWIQAPVPHTHTHTQTFFKCVISRFQGSK